MSATTVIWLMSTPTLKRYYRVSVTRMNQTVCSRPELQGGERKMKWNARLCVMNIFGSSKSRIVLNGREVFFLKKRKTKNPSLVQSLFMHLFGWFRKFFAERSSPKPPFNIQQQQVYKQQGSVLFWERLFFVFYNFLDATELCYFNTSKFLLKPLNIHSFCGIELAIVKFLLECEFNKERASFNRTRFCVV